MTRWHTIDVYRSLVRSRRFDEIALALQRQGALDAYSSARGQEAIHVAAARALEPDDAIFPSYRQPGMALERGISPLELFRFNSGESFTPWDWRDHRFATYTIPVGSQLAHAVGWAWGSRMLGLDEIALVCFGDGASSQGEVHEAMNYAGVVRAPVIFLLENNGWAISLPRSRQSAAARLCDRALGYGLHGLQVDGNDVASVGDAVVEARDRARQGGGSTLIEALTYRVEAHSTADDPKLYRDDDEVEAWRSKDPLVRFEQAAQARGDLSEADLAEVRDSVKAELDKAVDIFLDEPVAGGAER